MAKRKKRGPSLFGYFGGLLEEHPQWLNAETNDEIYARYRADHGLAEDAAIPDRVKNALANKKSLLRKDRNGKSTGTGKGKGKRGRKPRAGAAAAAAVRPAGMRALEVQIDDCLVTALTLDR